MEIQAQVQPFVTWFDLSRGISALLRAVATGGGLAGGCRLAVTPSGGVVLLARACEFGPESALATVHDWAGGYRLAVIVNNAWINLPPIKAEGAVSAALSAIPRGIAARGMPAPLEEFLPGGRNHQPDFDPRLPTTLSLEPAVVQAAVEAGKAAIGNGTSRSAAAAVNPDALHDGLEVFDVRLDPAALTDLVASAGMNRAAFAPLLIKQSEMGGGQHFLLVDGTVHGDGHLTWTRSPDGAARPLFWPSAEFATQSPSSLLLAACPQKPSGMTH